MANAQAFSPDHLNSLQTASERLGLSIWTLRAWAAGGRIATIKLGTRVLVAEDEIERIVREGTRPRRYPMRRPTLATPSHGEAVR